jgi:peptidoglycan/LPS O-acetylase OafA/YrhL
MGSFRTLLALVVVLVHSGGIWGYNITGGIIAVQSFYIVSGFYMSLILNKK